MTPTWLFPTFNSRFSCSIFLLTTLLISLQSIALAENYSPASSSAHRLSQVQEKKVTPTDSAKDQSQDPQANDQVDQQDADPDQQTGGFAINGERIATNFQTLVGNSWSGLTAETSKLIWSIFFWMFLFGFLGIVIAILLYGLFYYLGWASFRWKYFWTIGWTIPLLFVTCFSLGFAYSGGFYGARSYCYNAIEKDLLIERSAITMYCAVVMDQTDYEASVEQNVDQLKHIFENSEKLDLDFDDDFRTLLKEKVSFTSRELSWYESMVLNLGLEVVDGKIGEWVKEKGIDFRMLAVAVMDRKVAEEKFGKITVEQALATAAPFFKNGKSLAIGWIDVFLVPNITAGILIGAAIPLGVLLTLNIICRIIGWLSKKFPSMNQPKPIKNQKLEP